MVLKQIVPGKVGKPEPKNGGKMQVTILTFAVVFLEDDPDPHHNSGYVSAVFLNPDSRPMPPGDWTELGPLDPNSWKPTGVRLIE